MFLDTGVGGARLQGRGGLDPIGDPSPCDPFVPGCPAPRSEQVAECIEECERPFGTRDLRKEVLAFAIEYGREVTDNFAMTPSSAR